MATVTQPQPPQPPQPPRSSPTFKTKEEDTENNDITNHTLIPQPLYQQRQRSMNESFRRDKRTSVKFSILQDTESLFSVGSTNSPNKSFTPSVVGSSTSTIESITESTTAENKATEVKYHGPYAHIRKTLDYKYHQHYTKERQWLQDSIIDKLLHEIVQQEQSTTTTIPSPPTKNININLCCSDNSRSSSSKNSHTSNINDDDSIRSLTTIRKLYSLPSEPWLVYIVGKQSISKKSVIKSLMNNNNFPILGFILVDPDEIQTLLPEYSSYVQEYGEIKSMELMRKEIGYISEIMTKAALKEGLNVIVFSTFWNVIWFPSYFDVLRKDIPFLQIGILHVMSYDDEIMKQKEEENDGQTSLLSLIPNAFFNIFSFDNDNGNDSNDENENNENQRVFSAVAKLNPLVDYYCLFRMSSPNEENLDIINPLVDFNCLFQESSSNENSLDIIHAVRGNRTDKKQKLIKITWDEFSKTFEQKPVASFEGMSQGIEEMINRGERRNFIQQFDVHKSTEENYKADHLDFHGAYAHIRETLDYSYHQNYSKHRQMLQDAIMNDTLDAIKIIDGAGQVCTTPTEPFLVFTAGAMGAGKSYTLNYLHDKGFFPLQAFVGIDPDQIRQLLPEFRLYISENQQTAGEKTRKEAGYVVEILTLAALQAGKNVLVDTSLRDSDWYLDYIARIRNEYPNVKIAILHIDAPRESVLERARKRGLTTGRVVPDELLEKALAQVPKSVDILKHKVDFYCAINNPPNQEITLITKTMTWQQFTNNWIQTCAWIPKSRSRNKFKAQK